MAKRKVPAKSRSSKTNKAAQSKRPVKRDAAAARKAAPKRADAKQAVRAPAKKTKRPARSKASSIAASSSRKNSRASKPTTVPPRADGKTVGYAVVGLGHIAQSQVLPAFALAKGNSRLAALITDNEEKAAELGKMYGVPVYRDDQMEECLRSPDVDALFIALPNDMHEKWAVDAARVGAHVLCEKPLEVSAEACERMIAACEENDVRLMTAYRLHLEPVNLDMVKRVRDGVIGEPRYFSSTFSYQVKPGNIRTQDDKGGGALWDIGIYCLNGARMVFGEEPVGVFACAVNSGDERFTEVEETYAVTLKFEGGKVANFIASFGAATSGHYQVVGTKGSIELRNAYEYAGDRKWSVWVDDELQDSGTAKATNQFAPELIYFSNAVLDGTPITMDGHEGMQDIRLIEAMFESIRSGKMVSVEQPSVGKRVDPSEAISVSRQVKEPELVDAEAPMQH